MMIVDQKKLFFAAMTMQLGKPTTTQLVGHTAAAACTETPPPSCYLSRKCRRIASKASNLIMISVLDFADDSVCNAAHASPQPALESGKDFLLQFL